MPFNKRPHRRFIRPDDDNEGDFGGPGPEYPRIKIDFPLVTERKGIVRTVVEYLVAASTVIATVVAVIQLVHK